MTKAVLLNNIEHKDLKVDAKPNAKYGDNVNRSLAFSSEFGDLQKEYPILFHKDQATGEFQSHVVLGLDRDENLFLDDSGWLGNYVPAALARGPFLIGFQKQELDGKTRNEPVIHIDTESPRVGVENGEPVFLPFGGDSPYLENVMRSLQAVQQGAVFDKIMFSSFEAADLLEPVSIEITLNSSESYNLGNYYTINEEKLMQLEGDVLDDLHKKGVLQLAYLALSSLGNVQRIIDLKNKKSAIA